MKQNKEIKKIIKRLLEKILQPIKNALDLDLIV